MINPRTAARAQSGAANDLAAAASSSSSSSSAPAPRPPPAYIDIGANLLDGMYRGKYQGKKYHEPDLDAVLSRARKANVVAQIVTSGSLSESRQSISLCSQPGKEDLYCTVGCHPTRSKEVAKHPGGLKAYMAALDELLTEHSKHNGGRVVAVGECGLDYDRLFFSTEEEQKPVFEAQLDLAIKHRLPLFLHNRNSTNDFLAILEPRLEELKGMAASPTPAHRAGVVHSFTDSREEMDRFLSLGFYISVNGCSLKTEDQLTTIAACPLDRLMLETDAPWCSLKASHASAKHKGHYGQDWKDIYEPAAVKREKKDVAGNEGKMVKDRNEPCAIGQVSGVVARLKGADVRQLAEVCERNTRWVFGL
ncbi:hypothetical protein BDZ90DRAFT_221469 [Jaminaea rosea]|uniref:Mg-dependent DNase n=1 Tax=Jaminaea rosea TaxID=1569628 RepID=A0A316USQ7_9BASI|nr:hypothetical protein BDZ90DRAFT_221469 [Jaminaea rosea]PWN26913.1 hypothetical protein BDZ90DRAFT_221469 [Jaminaea rosea]